MANSISPLASVCKEIIDTVFEHEALTNDLRGEYSVSEFLGVNEVKIPKMAMQGLANHTRGADMNTGDLDFTWETRSLTQQRSRRFLLDRMDNEEELGLIVSRLSGEFTRTKVIPEVDAYRFTKIYSLTPAEHKLSPRTISSAAEFKAALALAQNMLFEAGVPGEGLVLYVSGALKNVISGMVNTITIGDGRIETRVREVDGITVRYVPDNRFHTQCEILADGEGGFRPAGQSLNFLLVHPAYVSVPVKLAMPKLFSPDSDDSGDNWRFLYRLYHDLFVLDNKVGALAACAQVGTPTQGVITMDASKSVAAGETWTIGATVNSGAEISYESSDTSVATIADGVVTGVTAGSATITASAPATAEYTAATATCDLTVTS